MFAIYREGLVLGVGATEADARADAKVRNEPPLEICEISERAAEYVRQGGEPLALDFVALEGGGWRIAHPNEP